MVGTRVPLGIVNGLLGSLGQLQSIWGVALGASAWRTCFEAIGFRGACLAICAMTAASRMQETNPRHGYVVQHTCSLLRESLKLVFATALPCVDMQVWPIGRRRLQQRHESQFTWSLVTI